MRLNHCFEVIGCLKSFFYYIATILHVETAQCRHKPIWKFTGNSYEGNLSCLTNSGLLRNRPSDAIKSHLRHFPASTLLKMKGSKLSETLHTCRVLRWSCCSQTLKKSLRSSDKRLSPSTQVLFFAFPLPTFFGSLQLPAVLYVFLRPFWLKCPCIRYDLKVTFALHNSVFKVILYYL